MPGGAPPARVTVVGAGWLGLALARRLAADGLAVAATTTTPARLAELREAGLEPRLLDLDDPAGPPAAGLDAGAVVIAVPPGRDRAAHPARLARLGAALGPDAWPVLLSSTGVYPDRPGAPATREEDAPAPEAAPPRARALLLAERALREAAPAATVLRLGGLWGPGREPGRWLAGRRDVPGPDEPVNLVHRDDAVAAVRAVLAAGARGATYDVVAPVHPPRAALYRARARALGLEPPAFAPGPAPGKLVTGARLREELGFRYAHPDPAAP